MAIEIERKFLVTGDAWRETVGTYFYQGYLNRDKNRTVRVRIAGSHGFLTIKGAATGITRAEFEYEIPMQDARQLFQHCDGPTVEKIRRAIEFNGSGWVVDEFLGNNQGLVVAEIELEREDQTFAKPDWIGEEVTHDPRYLNSSLSISPYRDWR